MTTRRKTAGEPLPFAEPPPYMPADINAIKAMFEGIANTGQQKRAMDWILTAACGMEHDPFKPENARLSDYLTGRQSVGRAILELKNARAATDVKGSP